MEENLFNRPFTELRCTPPCKDCTDREIGCHSNCEKYIEWKNEHNRKREVLRKDEDIKDFIEDLKYRRYEKYLNKKSKYKRKR